MPAVHNYDSWATAPTTYTIRIQPPGRLFHVYRQERSESPVNRLDEMMSSSAVLGSLSSAKTYFPNRGLGLYLSTSNERASVLPAVGLIITTLLKGADERDLPRYPLRRSHGPWII